MIRFVLGMIITIGSLCILRLSAAYGPHECPRATEMRGWR